MKKIYPIKIDENVVLLDSVNNPRLSSNLVLNKNVDVNETAALIFKCCDGKYNVDDIYNEIAKEYDVSKIDKNQVKKDIFGILDYFYENGFLKWKDVNPFSDRRQILSENKLNIERIWCDNVDSILDVYDLTLIDMKSNMKIDFDYKGLMQGIYLGKYVAYKITKNGNMFMVILVELTNIEYVWNIKKITFFDAEDLKDTFDIILYNINSDLKKMYKFIPFEIKEMAYTMNTLQKYKEIVDKLGLRKVGCIKGAFSFGDIDVYFKNKLF